MTRGYVGWMTGGAAAVFGVRKKRRGGAITIVTLTWLRSLFSLALSKAKRLNRSSLLRSSPAVHHELGCPIYVRLRESVPSRR